jgi:hypothetical protein
MHSHIAKDDPTYLNQLGAREGLAVARELYRENQKEFEAGRQLTVAEYQYLLKWASDRLIKNGEMLPLKRMSTDRYNIFEHSFYSTIRHEGML